MKSTVSMEGLAELEKALSELPKATARNTLRRVLTRQAEGVKFVMEGLAPRLTGYTAQSIEVSSTLNPAQRREQRKEGKDFAEVYVGSRRGSAAHLQEFGTINHPAQPYMRPAWEATRHDVLFQIGHELGEEIEKARARLARKAARLKAKG